MPADESDKWFTLRQQAARLYEANAISDAEKILQQALEMTARPWVIANIDWRASES